MKESQISTGKHIDGKEIFALTLKNTKGSVVKIYNYGGIISEFTVINAKGEAQDIVLGFDDLDGYLSEEYLAAYPYLGTVVGRFANRIKDGRYEIDGKAYQMDKSLHGGIKGFDRKVWDILPTIDPSITLQYVSPAGEEGFPGNLTVQLTYKLSDDNELILDYRAFTDAPTPVNLTHHTYFNLDPDKGSVAGNIIRIPASNYLKQDADYVPTGELVPVAGTTHDFLAPRAIGANWNEDEGYDQSFVLDKPYREFGMASETFDARSGLLLGVYTTEPIAHFYTAKHLNVTGGKEGKSYGSAEAFCVETQHAPNSVNIPAFPDTILRPGQEYHQTTVFQVTVRK